MAAARKTKKETDHYLGAIGGQRVAELTEVRKTKSATDRYLAGKNGNSRFLIDAINRIASSQTLDEALEKTVQIGCQAVQAERGTVFLNDEKTGELYSRVALGNYRREIRILNTKGIAGWCYTNGRSELVTIPYEDKRFAREYDEITGFTTRNILCAPLCTLGGRLIGVSQFLNKRVRNFTRTDLLFIEAITEQAAVALQSHITIEEMESSRQQEMEFLEVVTRVSSELNLENLLSKIITAITRMLEAERSTLFINDEKAGELFTKVGEGLGAKEIRFANTIGIAGTVFSSGNTINIPYAYADTRFNPAFDKQTGFFTRSILCVPVYNKAAKIIGVTQVLNKKGGVFSDEDETRLKAFTSQIAIAIENATLFNDVERIKNYNTSMLESMSNGVITIDADGRIATCNRAGRSILKKRLQDIIHSRVEDFLVGPNTWLFERIKALQESLLQEPEEEDEEPHPLETAFLDRELILDGNVISANISIQPLTDTHGKALGMMILIEDISSEKRVKSTMSRYMDAELAEKLMGSGEELLGGQQSEGTVLFSDIRSFTMLTESLGAQGTVALLNEYFTEMVDCIQDQGGMLDKFIGDAIMAIFGIPFPHDDDPDRAMRAAIQMMIRLQDLNEKRERTGHLAIDHGIGINTDQIVSGNIGSPKRMDYTVIGDGVNLAARLETACKKYGSHILVSDRTVALFKGTYRLREVDKVIVKGKSEPVGIFEAMDYHTSKTFPNMSDALGFFQEGFAEYQAGRWTKAVQLFRKGLKANPGDLCAVMYVDRCQELQKAGVSPKDWDGVWTMKEK